MGNLFNCIFALLALINPISKVFIFSMLSEHSTPEQTKKVAVKATMIALMILLLFAFTGNFILKVLFHVELYAFQIIGGLVLAYRGFQALNKGLFFEFDVNQKMEDASIVPLASPMIAGPATLTAAVTFPEQYGLIFTFAAIILSLIINLGFMLSARQIVAALKRFNLMGAIIRITGLIVATIGVQLMLDGFGVYFGKIL